jgi:hypothetical protein
MTNPKSKAVFVLLSVIALMASPGKLIKNALAASPIAITYPTEPIPEGKDFATLVLRDPWDMSQFTDISQNLNSSGSKDLVRNISVANGLFMATSSSTDASFYTLFPGYSRISVGKVGQDYPVDNSTYKCMYIAMQVNTSAADQFQIFWFANKKLANGAFGSTKGIPLYPEAGKNQPTPNMRLYMVNLSTTSHFNNSWNSMPSVQGIRIDPTLKANVAFSVDWVRLTNCNPVTATLTWTGGTSANTAIWLRPVGTTRDIRVASDVVGESGSYELDVQGIAPGSYYVGLGTANNCCSQMDTSSSPLVINQTAVITFTRPTFSSGPGISWDFNSKTDVTRLQNFKSTLFANGLLTMITASSNRPDPRVYLKTPVMNTNSFRYLSFRMYTKNGSAPWQNISAGMIARWIWTIKGPLNTRCSLISSDIAYDVGYQTYTIDLYDPYNGKALERAGNCAGLPSTWQASGSILGLRFDPNENVSCRSTNPPFVLKTCGDFVQKLDWIRLTRTDRVVRGTVFPIGITLNRLPSTLSSLAFYYTTSLSDPTQFSAVGTTQISSFDVTYQWDTKGVASSTYYICAQANDGYNPVIYCSESPVIVSS